MERKPNEKENMYHSYGGVCAFAWNKRLFYLRLLQSGGRTDGANLADMVDSADESGGETEPILYSKDKTVLPELAGLYLKNSDLVGWISVEDTNINYPVMQSKDNPDFYLKHDFDKGYSDYGCPYVQENCDVQKPSDNIIIYGHHMKNGSMFCDLEKFKSKDFWQEHKTVTFHTLTEKNEYEIVAVFIEKCKELSFYDTGVSAEYGDKLITLSTCEYSRSNGRLVVVAKKIAD